MAANPRTLADLLIVNDEAAAEYEISDILNKAPVISALAADEASNGTVHKYTKETAAPVVGFRAPNVGRDMSKSTDVSVTLNLKILDATHEVDQALADVHKRGSQAYVGIESERHLRQAYFLAEQQLWYGVTDGEAGGFTGLSDASNLNNVSDAQVVAANAAGTNLSSVYFLRTGMNDVQVIAGNDGLISVGETVTSKVFSSGTLSYPTYYTPILSWLGFQIGGVNSVFRLCNIPDAGGALLDDDLIYSVLSLFPSGMGPDMMVGTRRSLEQLRKSRTATSPSGIAAPTPSDVAGVPFIVTDSVSNSETVVAA